MLVLELRQRYSVEFDLERQDLHSDSASEFVEFVLAVASSLDRPLPDLGGFKQVIAAQLSSTQKLKVGSVSLGPLKLLHEQIVVPERAC